MINTDIIDSKTNDLSEKYLVKYYRFNENALTSLISEYLYFSNAENLNDIYECTLHNKKINFELPKSLDKTLKTNIGICSFSKTITNPRMWGNI